MLELKEYQKETAGIVENKFNSGINKTCIIWPTGLGKTIVPIDLIKEHSDKKFVIIAPRHSILKQTRQYMKENEISQENVMFYTYSGLSKMKEKLLSEIEPDYIILDEMHRAGAKEWGRGVDRLLEKYPEANTLGLTATPTRMDGKNMVEEKFNGDIAHKITLEEAIARGLLKMPKSYINAIYSLDGEIGDIEKSIEKIKDTKEKQKLETKLEEVKRRLQESKGLPEIFAERMGNPSGKYIIFCKDIDHMHEMMNKANEMFKGVNENIEIYDISSEKNNLQNEREIRHFKENNSDSLKLLYSVDMFNEGLHIKNAGIIMFRPTASWIVYLQQLGRTLGIEESGEVFDIVNNSRSSKDIYQFYESVKEIQKKEKIEGVYIDFTIYDELRDIQELLDEINESIHIDQLSRIEKIEYFKKLKGEGLDLSKIKQSDKSKDGKPIGRWITEWRMYYRQGRLSKDEIKDITILGIKLSIPQQKRLSNEEKMKYLKELKAKGVDLSKIKHEAKREDGIAYGQWIDRWKRDYRQGKLSPKEIDEMKELGIDFKKKKSSNGEKIEYLKELKLQGVDLSKIKREDKAEDGTPYGEWISRWKTYYGKGELKQKEIDKIKELGISIGTQRAKKVSKEEKIKYFKKLKEEGIDLSKIKLDDKTEDGKSIGEWIHLFKKWYSKGKLTQEEIEAIEKLGIDLQPQIREVYSAGEKIEYLRELKKQGVDLLQIKRKSKSEDGKPVGNWIVKLRMAYKRKKLSKEYAEAIEELEISSSLENKQKEKEQAQDKLEKTEQLYKQYEKILEENDNNKNNEGK